MSRHLIVASSRPTQTLLAVTALVTVALLAWIHELSLSGSTQGLTPIFFFLFAVGDDAGLKCALVVALAAALVPNRFPARPLLQWVGRNPGWVAAGSGTILACGAWTVYLNTPLCMDEYAAFFQSRVFAAGHIAGRFPPGLLDWLIPYGFQNYFLDVAHDTGHVTSAYWPSFSLLLAPFTWLGIPWVCNPLLSALTLVAVHRLALQVFGDRESAGLAVLLTAASPVFFADGISYYSMSAHLLANTLYASLLVAPTPRKAFVAGVVGSVALTLHNPVPHTLFALPWIVWLFRRPGGSALGLSLFAGYLPLCLVLGLGWFLLTSPSGGTIAHLSAPFALPTSTVFLARAIGIAKLWAWAVPGLLVLAAIGAWTWRHNRTCLLLTSSALLTLLGYIFVPFDQGHGWGYRYFHSAWIALPVLAAAALTRPPAGNAAVPPREIDGTRNFDTDPTRRFRDGSTGVVNDSATRAFRDDPPGIAEAGGTRTSGDRTARNFEDGATRTFVVACALLSLIAGTGLRAVQIRQFIAGHQSQMPAYTGTEHRVVILDTRHAFYGRDLVQNDPWLRERVAVMITHGPRADEEMLRAQFPQMHRVYADRFGSVWSAATAGKTGAAAELP